MKDETILDRLFTPFYERVRNPFMGSFIVSWLIVNWKAVYAAFFETDGYIALGYKNNIEYIKDLLCEGGIYNNTIILPLTGTLVYFGIVQFLSLVASSIVELFQSMKMKHKLDLIGRKGVTGDTYLSLYKELENEKNKLGDWKSNYETQVNQNTLLQIENKQLSTDKEKLEIIINTKNTDLDFIFNTIINYITIYSNIIKNNNIDLKDTYIKYLKEKYIDNKNREQIFNIKSNDNTWLLKNNLIKENKKYNTLKKEIWPEWQNALLNNRVLIDESHWVTSEINSTQQMYGGVYYFIEDFYIEDSKSIGGYEFDFCVDDYVKIYLNGLEIVFTEKAQSLKNFNFKSNTDYITPSNDIITCLKNGVNYLLFEVHNIENSKIDAEGRNPYGIIYSLKLKTNEEIRGNRKQALGEWLSKENEP